MGPSGKMSGKSLLAGGEDYRDVAIRYIEEMRQVLVANNLKMLSHRVGEVSFEVRVVGREAAPQGGLKGKQALSYFDEAKSHGSNCGIRKI